MAKKCTLKNITNAENKTRAIVLLFVMIQLSSGFVASANAIGSPFLDKDLMLQQWMRLCEANPQWASYESIGKTVKGKDIYMFKIGTPSAPKIMYDGEAHPTEDSGTEILYTFCNWLLESGDAKAQNILQTTYHLIVPVLDRDVTDGSKTNINGVNLNRNGVYGWGESGSDDSASEDYRGPSAGSEPETQALRATWQKWQPRIYVNTHHGYHFASYVSNTAFEQQIMARYKQTAASLGADNPYTFEQNASGGFLCVDADMSFGASGWCWEVLRWQDLVVIQGKTEDPYVAAQLLMNEVYDDAFPLLLAFAEGAAGSPGPTPSPTPEPPKPTPTPTISPTPSIEPSPTPIPSPTPSPPPSYTPSPDSTDMDTFSAPKVVLAAVTLGITFIAALSVISFKRQKK